MFSKLKNKLTLFMLFMLPNLVFAGTDDNLGVKPVWEKISDWLTDGYVEKIVAAIFLMMGIARARESILQFFIMLGYAVLVVNASTIIDKIAGATF